MQLEKIGAKDISVELLTKFWNNVDLTNNQVARHIVAMLASVDFDQIDSSLDNAEDLIKQAWKGMNTKIRVNKQQASMIRVNRSGGASEKGKHSAMTETEIQTVMALAPAPKVSTAQAADENTGAVEVDEGTDANAADTGYAAPSAKEVEEAANAEDVEFVGTEKEKAGFWFKASVLNSTQTFQGETAAKAFEQARKYLVEKRFSKAVIKRNGQIIDVGDIANGDTVTIAKQLVAAANKAPQLDIASDNLVEMSVQSAYWNLELPLVA
jgi:predicted amino acid-binding ACT domain protein